MDKDELIHSRSGYSVAVAEFLQEFNSDKNTCYGFIEGDEDFSFYRNCIENRLPTGFSISLYSCDGKKGVKSAYENLNRLSITKKRVVFFMDRDLSDLVEDENVIEDENVFITKMYSIENSILCKHTFVNVLKEVVGFRKCNSRDFDILKKFYDTKKSKFEEMLLPIMANIIHWKREGIKANYNNFQLRNHVLFNKSNQILWNRPESEVLDGFYSESGVCTSYYDEEKINAIVEEIKKKQLEKHVIRGHFLTVFFVKCCNHLRNNYQSFKVPQPINSRDLGFERDYRDVISPRGNAPQELKDFIDSTLMMYCRSVPVV